MDRNLWVILFELANLGKKKGGFAQLQSFFFRLAHPHFHPARRPMRSQRSHSRMNADVWMREVIDHLRAATEPVSIATLHAHTNAAETEETASLLAEHSSIALVEGDRVTFAPHASVRTRSELGG